MRRLLLLGLMVAGLSPIAYSADGDSADSEAAIREIGAAYVAAFNNRDAEGLAGFWSPEAVYTNRATGEQVVGREGIAAQFEAIFAGDQKITLKVDVDSIDFVSPNVAVESGVATFLSGDSDGGGVDYSAVYIRREGKWLLDRVSDNPAPATLSHYEQLKDLEWMVGSWVDQSDGASIVTECNWTKNQNFLTRSFSVSIDDRIDLSGIQFVGWDPAAKQIRSWTFDSDGGFSEGHWTKNDDRWYIRKKGTTADGKKATALNVVTVLDDDSFKLKSIQRTIDGDLLPNVDEVIVVRR